MNPSTHPAGEPSPLDPVYGLRDDLAEQFKPANAYERLLVTAAAQAWLRCQNAQNLERRLFEKTDPLELLEKNPGKFKLVTRYVTDCDRAWRKALEEIRRTIRQRQKTLASPNARRSSERLTTPLKAATPIVPNPPAAPAPAPARRE